MLCACAEMMAWTVPMVRVKCKQGGGKPSIALTDPLRMPSVATKGGRGAAGTMDFFQTGFYRRGQKDELVCIASGLVCKRDSGGPVTVVACCRISRPDHTASVNVLFADGTSEVLSLKLCSSCLTSVCALLCFAASARRGAVR